LPPRFAVSQCEHTPNFKPNPESVCVVLRAAVKAKPYGVEHGIQAACRLPAKRCALESAQAPCKGCAAWTEPAPLAGRIIVYIVCIKKKSVPNQLLFARVQWKAGLSAAKGRG